MTLSVEITDEVENQYKFLRDIFYRPHGLTNKEVVEKMIENEIKRVLKIFHVFTYELLLDLFVKEQIITEQERKALCQKTN